MDKLNLKRTWRQLLPKAPLAMAVILSSLMVISCSDSGINPNDSNHSKTDKPNIAKEFGLVKVVINGDKEGNFTATASPVKSASPKQVATGVSGVNDNSGTHGSALGTIQLKPIAMTSFNSGEFGGSGKRYLSATFAVRNADVNGDAYTTPMTNMVFIAAHTPNNIGQTAITDLTLFDGTSYPGATSYANSMMPTGQVGLGRLNNLIPTGVDVMQVFSESTVAGISVNSGVTLFPYGFTVVNRHNGSRTLPGTPTSGQYDGIMTFTFATPLPSSLQDLKHSPYHFVFMFKPVVNSDIRITQALQEQTKEGRRLLADHVKNDLGGASNVDQLIVFPGSRLWQLGEPLTQIDCDPVRITGTSGNIVTPLQTPNQMKQVGAYPFSENVLAIYTIHGCDFTGSETVKVGGATASVVSNDATHLKFTLPANLTLGKDHDVTVTRGSNSYDAGNVFVTSAILNNNASVTSNCPPTSLLGCTFKHGANMTDSDLDNAGVLGGVLNLGGMYVDVKYGGLVAGGNGQQAGFVMSRGGGLLGANLLGNIEIKTFKNGSLVDDAKVSGGAVTLGLLEGANKSYVSFESTGPFDEIKFIITGISAGPDFQFYGAYGDTPVGY